MQTRKTKEKERESQSTVANPEARVSPPVIDVDSGEDSAGRAVVQTQLEETDIRCK
jgi:hypothetical protein